MFVDLGYCFMLLLKRIRIAVVDLAFPSIMLSNGTVGIRLRVVFANDKSKDDILLNLKILQTPAGPPNKGFPKVSNCAMEIIFWYVGQGPAYKKC
ncbi:hypothetical protein BDQ94DRAFT_155278 [Aspergillus welwitschiae]|uniref:Uncharacterized protein n=1 Tax=Aspergillus welwitschiae TaxID=1341132 RepID=A0A3F3PIM0_9EURO|nr:hypothetical protein BDQ94DRAFT_155278 [Aspergillus welwitschiae]RDH26582.1 hypothetical protein BDQ94DRAFT_155278 [Aspergillus welwitschiae]